MIHVPGRGTGSGAGAGGIAGVTATRRARAGDDLLRDAAGRCLGLLAVIDDVRPRDRVDHVKALIGRASIAGGADIGDVDTRARGEGRGGATILAPRGTAAGDGHGGTVHVHLAVADLVVPRPRHDGLSRWRVGGDCEVEVRRAGRRAVALDTLDDGEGLGAVHGQADLARAAAVVRASGDGHVALGASGKRGGGRTGGGAQDGLVAFAREIRPVSLQWGDHVVIDVGRWGVGVVFALEWRRKLDFHVGRGGAQKGEQECCRSEHVEDFGGR